MTAYQPAARLLVALLTLGQEDESIDLFSIAEEAGLSLFSALKGLEELVQRRLVSSPQMRLTMAGLGLACSLTAEEGCELPERQPCSGGEGSRLGAGLFAGRRGHLWRVA